VRCPLDARGGEAAKPGIVDEPAPGRDVSRIRDRLPAAGGNRLHRPSVGVGIHVVDHHGDTCLGSRNRVRGAESASGAGDGNDLAVQERHLDFLVSVRALPAERGPIYRKS
jgi:hypothetical protein